LKASVLARVLDDDADLQVELFEQRNVLAA